MGNPVQGDAVLLIDLLKILVDPPLGIVREAGDRLYRGAARGQVLHMAVVYGAMPVTSGA